MAGKKFNKQNNSNNNKKKENKMTYKRKPIVRSLGQAFPDILKVKLRYNARVAILSASGVMANHNFRVNSVYDPDATYAGHQPLGVDNLFALYDRVLVTGVKYTVRAISDTAPMEFVVYPYPAGITAPSNIETAKEYKNSQCRMLTTSETKYCKGYVSMKKLRGLTSFGTSDSDYCHTSSGNPTEFAYLKMSAASVDGATSSTLRAVVTLDYYCTFFERKKLTQN